MRKKGLLLFSTFSAAITLIAGVTYALYTAQQKVSGASVLSANTGFSISLTTNGESPAVPFNIDHVYPGYWSDWSRIIVTNNSTDVPLDSKIAFPYIDGAILYNQLVLQLGRTTTNCADMPVENIFYNSWLSSYDSNQTIITNLAAHDSSRICVKVGVNSGADNSILGQSAYFDIQFDAVQHL